MNYDSNHHQNEQDVHHTKKDRQQLSPWLIAGFMFALLSAGLYLGMNSGGFRQDVYESDAVNWAGGGSHLSKAVDPKIIGKRLFSQNCIVCHQANGQGIPGQFPPLPGSEWVNSDNKHGENHLIMLMLDGHQGIMNVRGGNYNNAMPQWKQLSDEQIANILTYIRSDWGNNAPAISATYVAEVRKKYAQRMDSWTQQQLMSIPPEQEVSSASLPRAK